ncbi:MAG: hypothetical protein ABI702_14725 [Burkholderiales bacterium]
MFKPSDLAALLIAVPLAAVAGVTGVGPTASSVATLPADAAGYQIRCWQNGSLLFEETLAALPEPSQYGLRLGGRDRAGHPVYVADTQNATCLIRRASVERIQTR